MTIKCEVKVRGESGGRPRKVEKSGEVCIFIIIIWYML